MTDMPYDANAWMTDANRAGRVFNYNYRMAGNELRGWELAKTVVVRSGPEVAEIAYIWRKRDGDDDELVRVDVGEARDWRQAQALLQGHLQHTMRPAMPGGAAESARVGDVGFSASVPETDTEAAIFFSVGNVALTVRSVGSRAVDVAPIAEELSVQLGPPPSVETPAPMRRMERPRFKVKKDESISVIDAAPPAVARSGWIKLIAPAGEFRREDQKILFTPSESGEQQIEEYRMGG